MLKSVSKSRCQGLPQQQSSWILGPKIHGQWGPPHFLLGSPSSQDPVQVPQAELRALEPENGVPPILLVLAHFYYPKYKRHEYSIVLRKEWQEMS